MAKIKRENYFRLKIDVVVAKILDSLEEGKRSGWVREAIREKFEREKKKVSA